MQSRQDGLSSRAGTSLALETLGAWFSESAAGVTPFDTSVASRGHSGGSYQPCCCPPASPRPPSVLLWQASHAGPASQIPVTTHHTAPVPGDQLKNPVPGVTAVPCAAEPPLCSAWEMDTLHVVAVKVFQRKMRFTRGKKLFCN